MGRDERICWVARDAEIGDRVADELVAWLGDPDAVTVLEPRSALAYERSELIRDESAARVATLARWRSGRARVLVASVQALLQPTILADDLPATPRTLRAGDRVRQADLLVELLRMGYEPVLEVAGRGEMARRGGLVDVFPAGAELPVRIELFGDEIDGIRVFDPTDQRTVRAAGEVAILPATEFLAPAAGLSEINSRLGSLAGRLPERLRADLSRFTGDGPASDQASAGLNPGPARARPRHRPPDGRRVRGPGPWRHRPAPSTSATPPRSGRPSSARRAASTIWPTTRCWWSTSRAKSPPRPTSCGSRRPSGGATSSSRASSRMHGPTHTSRRGPGRRGSSGRALSS